MNERAQGESKSRFPAGRWPGETQVYSADECFLCGVGLRSETRTDEHIFPGWMQHEFDLSNQRLDLLNGTSIPYRQLKIPCCSECNGGALKKLEDEVAKAYRQGFDAFAALDRRTLFLWLGKILYGLLVREQFLALDRCDPASGSIVDQELLDKFRMHHYLLQATLGRVDWERNPASVRFYRTQVGTEAQHNFDYADGPFGPFLGLRLGPVGIVAVLQDWGAFEAHTTPLLEKAERLTLAPVQFREVMACARYTATQFNRTPRLLIGQTDGATRVTCLPLSGLSGRPMYDAFVAGDFARVLAFSLRVPLDAVLLGSDVASWLSDNQGRPLQMPFNAHPNPLPLREQGLDRS